MSECHAHAARIAHFGPSAGAEGNNAVLRGYVMRRMSARRPVPRHPAQPKMTAGTRTSPMRQHKRGTSIKLLPPPRLPRPSIWKKNSPRSPTGFFFPDNFPPPCGTSPAPLRQETNFFQQRRKFLAAKKLGFWRRNARMAQFSHPHFNK